MMEQTTNDEQTQQQQQQRRRRRASATVRPLTPEMPASALPPLLTQQQVRQWTRYSRPKITRLEDADALHPQRSTSDTRFRLYPRDEVVRVREADPRYRTATEPQGDTPLGAYSPTIYPPETPASALPLMLSTQQVVAWVPIRKQQLARYVAGGQVHTIPSAADQRYTLYLRDEIVQIREERTRTGRAKRSQVGRA